MSKYYSGRAAWRMVSVGFNRPERAAGVERQTTILRIGLFFFWAVGMPKRTPHAIDLTA
jgi:hypothetical protein